MPPIAGPVRIELVHFQDCPHVDLARSMIRRALAVLSLDAAWMEWDTDAPSTPARYRAYGSPTILVHDRDVRPDMPVHAGTCRLYLLADGSISGAPSAESIANAIREVLASAAD